jgi:hypothetical protein
MPAKASNTNPTLVVALDKETIQALAAALAEVLKGGGAPTPEPEEDEEDFEAEEEKSDQAEEEEEGDEEDEEGDEEEEEGDEEPDEYDEEEEGDEEPDEHEEAQEEDEEEESDDDYWTVDSLVALGRRGLRRMAREHGVEYDRDTEDADIAQSIIEAMNEEDEEE